MTRFLLTWLSGSLEVLFPRECLVCTRPLKGQSLCFRCAPASPTYTTIRCQRCYGPMAASTESGWCATCTTFPPPTTRMRYLWEYSGCARDLITAMKYRPSAYLTKFAGHVLNEELPRLFEDRSWDLVIPIPSSPSMLKKRLFHPCHEIAKVVAGGLPQTKLLYALRHRRSRTPQARLSHEERLRGLRYFFKVRKPSVISGKKILLIEDVITTGATIAAAAHALYAAGALEVDVVSLTQARVWSRFRALLYRTGVGYR